MSEAGAVGWLNNPHKLVFMVLFLSAERFGHFEQPMSNSVFDLPMYRFCGTITGRSARSGSSVGPGPGERRRPRLVVRPQTNLD